jgi:prolipoprotein diacylglyceryl transferase
MPLANLPGPFSGLWRLGPITVHGYALCVVLGVLALLALAEFRYRAAGGRPWLMVDIATVAVPAGLVGARVYRIMVDYQGYFGHGRDWVDVLRVWDGGLGLPGAAIGGLAAAWVWCRYHDLGFGPVLAAAAPGVAVGAGISLLGNWFAQSLYGPPATVPWAVPIAPASRVAGYQDFATFQPLFLYEALWDILVGLTLIQLIRQVHLTGDRAIAVCVGGYALGVLGAQSLALTGTQNHTVLVIKQLAAVAVAVGVIGYLYLTRARLGPEPLTTGPRRRRLSRSSLLPLLDDSMPSPNASRTASDLPRPAEVAGDSPEVAGDSLEMAGDSPGVTGDSAPEPPAERITSGRAAPDKLAG